MRISKVAMQADKHHCAFYPLPPSCYAIHHRCIAFKGLCTVYLLSRCE